jgi:hypothetical protein
MDRMTSFQSVRTTRCLHYWRRIYRLCLKIGVVAGDKICIFCGKPSIYIRHPKPIRDAHEFISDEFTLGLMAGEASEVLESRAIKDQEFVIE